MAKWTASVKYKAILGSLSEYFHFNVSFDGTVSSIENVCYVHTALPN